MKKIMLAAVCILIVGGGYLGWSALRPAPVAAPTPTPHLHGLNAPAPATPRATLFAAAQATPKATPKPKPTATRTPTPAPSSRPYLVLIVLDGAQPSYFSTSGIPHVRQLIRNGTQYTDAFAGILESETPSGHASITSGSQPRTDGILSFDWANSDNIPMSLFSPQKILNGDMERIMRSAPAPSIAGLIHKANPKAKVVALSGYKYYAADALGGPDADVIMYYDNRTNGTFGPRAVPGHVPPAGIVDDPALILPSRNYPLGMGNRMAMKMAGVTFQKMHQQATLINLPEFDYPLGHVDGAGRDQKDTQTLMRDFDSDLAGLENIYRRAGVLNKTLFVLTADHGFAAIDHKISHTIVNDAVAAAGTSIVRDTYHTAAYVWIKDETKAAQAAANIAAKRNPYIQSVYFRSQGAHGPVYLRATGSDLLRAPGTEAANQWLLSTFNGPNGPDIAVFMDEHAMLVAGGESSWKGDHGGAAWESQHLPLIISGPGVKRGQVSSYPAPLMDIAPTVLSLLGIEPKGMQGVQLADAFTHAPAWMWTKQQSQGRVLRPVVTALKAESQRELALHL
jgi:hypothetical protein